MNRKANKGFTLIELLVVIAIIAMLSSVVLSSLGDARTRAKNTATLESLRQVKNALNLYGTDMGGFPQTLSALVTKGSISYINPALSYYPTFLDETTCANNLCPSYVLVAFTTNEYTKGGLIWNDAIKYCSSLGVGFRLPTKNEMTLLINNFSLLDATWTSTENPADQTQAWFSRSLGSYSGYGTKTFTLNARCIQSIK